MNFNQLISAIETTHHSMQGQAAQSVNTALTLRNWLIGYYIVEFEQKGQDRAIYGKQLLKLLADKLQAKKIKGISQTNLILYRQFYVVYPQIYQTVSNKLSGTKSLSTIPKNQVQIYQTVSDKLSIVPNLLLKRLTFSHFVELVKVEYPLKRTFYESQCIKSNWSVRELKRQIGSLLFERTGKSKNKKSFLKKLQKLPLSPEEIIKNPYVFEFLNLEEKSEYTESLLETELVDHLQKFLLELGRGFCFEARQKRITVNNQHYYIDLVFYHRILKCHVLIDLKVREFAHTDAGQMNFYLNYMNENEMEKNDNPPVGIILCTHDNKAEVKYATAGINNRLFVSRYMLQLPTENELKAFLQKDIQVLNEENTGK
ncbi:MAG: cytoplasmic protein [Elusimicrobia bacterium RIFCSPLOWO2_02_FULL_39_32]|nr:MAG: cytoplasmic protein [Elusimicrobia bacterium GWA2_38_7]OGR80601.1 MAG: cytoplasmic protein [Elusimicrobia bacterium RIFCSPHIGHO2_02_FULL_39_36]OGR91282.1 MAG: cytoplasmic protein [Elusimicrobia bacterium RIFCSPLOWO2_02_FULL_39_32]OGS00656.1 MAG: cytoplasmic protein [Elusimicrobia bacterium RIFCSPLOWO2_12_FULL_39_28]